MGKFASGAKVVIQVTTGGTLYIKAQGAIYAADGTCDLVTSKKAQFRVVFNDDSAYALKGTIVRIKGDRRTLSGIELKNGKAIDRVSLNSTR